MRARATDARTWCAHVRACGCVCGRPRICAEPGEPCRVGVDRVRLGAQAFFQKVFASISEFNANISAWNTARVTDLSYVCAACLPGGGPPRASRTRSAGAAMRRGPLCAAAPPMFARVRTRVGTRLHRATWVGMAVRRTDLVYVHEYIYMNIYVYAHFTHTYMN
jgi:surface protein